MVKQAAYNVTLTAEPPSENLPFAGQFHVMEDGLLVRGHQSGLETFEGIIDMESTSPRHVDFTERPDAYLHIKSSGYYLEDRAIEVMPKTVKEIKRTAHRYRT